MTAPDVTLPAAPAAGPHARDAEDVLATLASGRGGLGVAEAKARLARTGPNRIAARPPVSNIALLARQFTSPIVVLLIAAVVLSAALGDTLEAVAIGIVLAVNALIGFVAENRAVRSMEALRRLDLQAARVRRDGEVHRIDADGIVPGDVVLVEAGDRIPADLRIIIASRAAADESALTGESLPVGKADARVSEAAPIHDQTSMLWKGTSLVSGSAEGVAVRTGPATELGRIATLASKAGSDRSPLEVRLAALARQLIWLTLVIAAGLAALGIASGEPFLPMIEAAIALAVAAVPEGLPIVATLALARGMLRMARANAVVRRLGAIETLGATTVILTDKTGTLTENRMAVVRLVTVDDDNGLSGDRPPGPVERRALAVGVLCSNAVAVEGRFQGDPVEVALAEATAGAGLDPDDMRAAEARVLEHPFDPTTRMMATVHRAGAETFAAVKGAPEVVLARATRVATATGDVDMDDRIREHLLALCADLAAEGLRLIALAEAHGERSAAHPFEGLTFLAVAALSDPPRTDIADAIAACHRAGIHVVMVTGDHPATARAIARSDGLSDGPRGASVHARALPEDKLRLAADFQAAGEIVAMTGDGVNDAPALRQADIGVAMGIRGTDVAREAADIVLLDDAFATIVVAIREGRLIFANIRRFCVYLLSCNLGEVLLIALAILAGLPLPLTPLQILLLNIVTDVFPAFALAMGRGDPRALDRPPRPAAEPILGRRQWADVALFGILIGGSALTAFAVALHSVGLPLEEAVTVAFLATAFGQLGHVFNMRGRASGIVANEVTTNLYIWLALAGCTVIVMLALFVPPLGAVLGLVPLDTRGWLVALAGAAAPLVLGQLVLVLSPRPLAGAAPKPPAGAGPSARTPSG